MPIKDTKSNLIERLHKLNISSDEVCKTYEKLLHYCNVGTLGYILGKLTLRCSSLDNASLNDRLECQRKNIERYAGNIFIACFCHYQQEIVPFWFNYGGNAKSQKVLLRFKNFAPNINKCIHTDYCKIDNNKKMFFYSDEYKHTINNNGILGTQSGLTPINSDYDINNCIKSVLIKDVEYLPISDLVFTKDYSGYADVSFGDSSERFGVASYDVRTLGRHKTIHWEYEKETRIICSLGTWMDHPLYNYIDLRLKEDIFEDLEIILNPWAKKSLKYKIQHLIDSSLLNDGVKKSITIHSSELHGLIK